MNLLFHQAALGDFVLTFPTLRGMEGDTVVVSSWGKADLAARVLARVRPMGIDLFEFTRMHAPGGPSALSPAVRELFEGAQTILSFVSDGQDAWAENAARLAPQARRVFVRPRPPEDWAGHVVEWHRSQIREQGMEIEPGPVPSRTREPMAGPLVIHPGSGGADKCWPAERFEAVIAALRAEGRAVQPVFGEVEAERWPEEQARRWIEKLGAQFLPSLEALRAVLDGAGGFLGNDSGPSHLAAQMGLPTVAIFGPTRPLLWAPLGPAVTVLAPETPRPVDWLSVEAVLAACRRDD